MASLTASALAPPAIAGPWPVEGGPQHIVSGARAVTEDIAQSELSAFSELPLGFGWSAIGAGQVEQREELIRSEGRLLGKIGTAFGDGGAAALQGGLVAVDDPSGACAALGGEAAALAGWSWGGPAAGFLSIEAGYRSLGACEGPRGEIALGLKPRDDLMLLGQVFHDGAAGADTLKIQGSVVVFSAQGLGVQVGGRVRLDGEDRQPAVTLGLWAKP